MRRLLPSALEEVDLLSAYAPPQHGVDPFVRGNMISSVDGAIAVEGRSGELGGPADREVFAVLRSLADVILVGAGTVRAEGYGPPRLDAGTMASRERRGQSPVPALAVVTRSGALDWSAPFFTEALQPPLVLTTADVAGQAATQSLGRAEVLVAGQQSVELNVAIEMLQSRGLAHVLCEGGPALNAQLVHERLLDELCLTVAPCLVAGTGPRVLSGNELVPPVPLGILQLLEQDGYLFYRLGLKSRSG